MPTDQPTHAHAGGRPPTETHPGDAAELIPSYVAAGVPVLPLHTIRGSRCTCGRPHGKGPRDCQSPGKHPVLAPAHRRDDPLRQTCHGECGRPGHGLYDATLDLGVIAEWMGRWPGCNWGVRPPAGVVVLDIDPRNGGDESLAELEARHGALPHTLTAITGSGGRHIWLTYNGPARGKLAAGIDVKTSTGYLVAPPSLHVSGGHYRWSVEAPAAYAPRWVQLILNPPRRPRPFAPPSGQAGLDALVRFVAEATEGERNRRLFWAACRAAEKNLDPEPLIEAAVSIGLDERGARATVRSAERAPQKVTR
jgi:hypothetical protein